MPQLLPHLYIVILGSMLAVSCSMHVQSEKPVQSQFTGVDWVFVYQDDKYDSIPQDKIVYQVAWGNTADSLKPKFDIHFCKENFRFPYYFPDKKQLRGKAGQTLTINKNDHADPFLQTIYTLTYDSAGRIARYAISGPATLYSCDMTYDSLQRIAQITDGWKKMVITYNDFGNIDTIAAIDSNGEKTKALKFVYTYVAFPRR